LKTGKAWWQKLKGQKNHRILCQTSNGEPLQGDEQDVGAVKKKENPRTNKGLRKREKAHANIKERMISRDLKVCRGGGRKNFKGNEKGLPRRGGKRGGLLNSAARKGKGENKRDKRGEKRTTNGA